VKINLFMKNYSRFFDADGKGRTLLFTSKFFHAVLFTFAAHSIHKSSENFPPFCSERAAKIRAYLFPANLFHQEKC